jgi:hypothetical protein
MRKALNGLCAPHDRDERKKGNNRKQHDAKGHVALRWWNKEAINDEEGDSDGEISSNERPPHNPADSMLKSYDRSLAHEHRICAALGLTLDSRLGALVFISVPGKHLLKVLLDKPQVNSKVVSLECQPFNYECPRLPRPLVSIR